MKTACRTKETNGLAEEIGGLKKKTNGLREETCGLKKRSAASTRGRWLREAIEVPNAKLDGLRDETSIII